VTVQEYTLKISSSQALVSRLYSDVANTHQGRQQVYGEYINIQCQQNTSVEPHKGQQRVVVRPCGLKMADFSPSSTVLILSLTPPGVVPSKPVPEAPPFGLVLPLVTCCCCCIPFRDTPLALLLRMPVELPGPYMKMSKLQRASH
jgi:hypothetical protein